MPSNKVKQVLKPIKVNNLIKKSEEDIKTIYPHAVYLHEIALTPELIKRCNQIDIGDVTFYDANEKLFTVSRLELCNNLDVLVPYIGITWHVSLRGHALKVDIQFERSMGVEGNTKDLILWVDAEKEAVPV